MEIAIMKFKFVALILTLTIASWAQTTNSAQPAASEKTADTKCACCDKMGANASEHKHACMHAKSSTKDGKDVASCCSGKDDASCCKGKDGKSCAKMQTASAACCEGNCTAGGAKGYCTGKDGKTAAHDCCGGKQCMHDHSEHTAPGN
jgi:hypothetical protein